MIKKALINSLVGLFFLYVLGETEKERVMYKKKFERVFDEKVSDYKDQFHKNWKEGYKKGYETAIEDINRSLDSLTAQERDHAVDDVTRYS